MDRWIQLWTSLSRRRLEREVLDELDFHLEMRTREYQARGLSPKAARRLAEERFGDVGRLKHEAVRTEWARVRKRERALYMDEFRQDLRYGFRQLWKRPGFSIIALAMLALGIGANTAIFSVVQTVLLRPLPFPQPQELLQLWESRVEQGWTRASFSPANFWDVRDMNRSFLDVGAYRWTQANLIGPEFPEQLRAGRVTAGFFGTILKVDPALGRTFLPEEGEAGSENRVALLSHDFWEGHFGGDASVLGTTITLDEDIYTVVGVLPSGEPWLDYGDVFLPMIRDPDAARGSFEVAVVGRLLPGVTVEAAVADLEGVARRLEELYPEIDAGMGISWGSSEEWVASDNLRRALWILLGAVGFLLMIACVNLANLLLAQASGRVRETAVRAAVGAGRGRLLRQALTESLLLSTLGAGLGLLLALWGLDLVRALDPGGIPRLDEVSINRWVLAFTLGAGILTGVVTGLVPAIHGSGTDAGDTLRGGGRSISGSRAQRRLRGALVATELALSLALLVGAGLLFRSFTEILSVNRGFQTENRLLTRISLPPSYGGPETTLFLQQFEERVRLLPPVREVAAVSSRPLSGGNTGLGFVRPDHPEPEGGIPWATWRLVTSGYFDAMGIPILRGRTFSPDDRLDPEAPGPLRVLVSQRFADLLWPGEDPIGKIATLWAGQDGRPGEVIGVAGDIRERGLDADPTLAVYLPFYGIGGWSPEFVVHTVGNPTAVVPALRSLLAELDPNLPLSDIQTLDEVVGASVAERRFVMALVGLFAALSLLLALAGVYGVQAYSVAQQTSEIGVRVALGSGQKRIIRRIVLQAMGPALLGIGVGLGTAVGLSRFLASLLFQVGASDPKTYLEVSGVLLAAVLLASWVPARRAAKVDPVIAFRSE
jgi:predicted permease